MQTTIRTRMPHQMRSDTSYILGVLLVIGIIRGGGAQTIAWGPPNEEKYIHGQLTISPFDFKPGTSLSGAQKCLQPSNAAGGVIIANPCLTPVSGDYGALLDKWTFNFTDNSVRSWGTQDRQPTSLCLDGGSLTLAPGSGLVGTQIVGAACDPTASTQRWEWDEAYLKILNNNRWLSPAADRSGHFQLGVDRKLASPINFVLPPFTEIDTYTLQPTLAHSADETSDIGDGPGPCQYGFHRAGAFFSSKECAVQCDSEPKCLGFTFGLSSGVGCCYLKAWFPAAQSTGTSGFSTYVKGTSDVASFPALALPASQAAAAVRLNSGGKSSNNIGAIVGGICAGVAVLSLLLCCCLCLLFRRRKRNRKEAGNGTGKKADYDPEDKYFDEPPTRVISTLGDPADPSSRSGNSDADIGDALGPSWRAFTYQELRTATGDFAPGNLLGEGAFGRVYRGALTDGSHVAIKQLKAGPKGFNRREFLDELRALSNVRHRNLVALRGYCAIENAHYFLVLDMADGGDLSSVLHDNKGGVLSWESRIDIAVAAAGGLSYLHNDADPPIIHRDIKSANILLDSRKVAQVADFGLARLMLDGDEGMTVDARGTFGYVAPEYVQEGLVSKKLDVYSFGVVLLELLTGLKAMHQTGQGVRKSLVEVARQPGVDPRLNGNFSREQALNLHEIAMACIVRHENRPDMSAVYRALQDLAEGSGGTPGNIFRPPRSPRPVKIGSPVPPFWAGAASPTSGSNASSELTPVHYGVADSYPVGFSQTTTNVRRPGGGFTYGAFERSGDCEVTGPDGR